MGKKNRSILLFLIGFAIAMTSCETIVDVDIPNQKPELVVNGLFSPDSTWRVQVTSAAPFAVSPSFQRPVIENPVIEIWDQNQRITQFTRDDAQPGGWYVAPVAPAAGQNYSIRVSSDGYDTVEGIGEIPARASIEQFATELISPTREEPGRLDFTITLNDTPAHKNYYGLDVIWHTEQFDLETGENYRGTHHIGFTTNDPSLIEPDLFDPDDNHTSRVFFTDDLFEGRTHDLDFSVHISFFPSPDFQIIQRYDVLMYSLSEDMYRYLRTAEQQQSVRDDPFAEPVQIHSNLSNGYGIFAGYQVRTFSVNPDTLTAIGN